MEHNAKTPNICVTLIQNIIYFSKSDFGKFCHFNAEKLVEQVKISN